MKGYLAMYDWLHDEGLVLGLYAAESEAEERIDQLVADGEIPRLAAYVCLVDGNGLYWKEGGRWVNEAGDLRAGDDLGKG